MELKIIQQKLVTNLDEAERIRAKYNGKPDTMSGEEIARWQALLDEGDTLKRQIDLFKREESIKAWASDTRDMLKLAGDGAPRGTWSRGDPDGAQSVADPAVSRYQARIKSFFRAESGAATTVKAAGPGLAVKDLAAQEMDIGGALVVPQELVTRLLALVKDLVYVRQLATVYQMDKAESLGVPVLDTDLSDPTWTSELSTGSFDTVTPFSKRQLSPHPLAKGIKISNKLLRQASIDPEAIVMDRLAYRFARTEEVAFLTGSGADQPLGVLTASTNGIGTGQDTTTAGSGTVAADDVITTKHSLKSQYWPKATWFMHRLVLAVVRKLKDSSGNYVWQPGLGGYVAQGTALVGTQPDLLLGQPLLISEVAPSAITSGNYVAVLGDFSFYWIVDALNIQIQRLTELYAATNQVGFIGRKETDGMPVLAEAFVRLKVQ